MKRYKYLIFDGRKFLSQLHFIQRIFHLTIIIIWSTLLNSCQDFVEIELPSSQLNADGVFADRESANAAINAIYADMRDGGILGYLGSRIGNYSDELDHYGSTTAETEFFYTNSLTPSNPVISKWWNESYYQIYCTNDIIERVEISTSLSQLDKNQLKGEALFVRGLIHFYLSQLFGDIPYATTTDYEINTKISKSSQLEVLNKVEGDLVLASGLLKNSYSTPDRTHPNKGTVMALLARVHLYNQNWKLALDASTYVINQKRLYPWNNNLETIFLKDSKTTLWQWSPGHLGSNTNEASGYIFNQAPPLFNALTVSLIESFVPNDIRLTYWIRKISGSDKEFYHPYKYKERGATDTSIELTVVFRLAEQYLIRSEARAHLNDLKGADSDLNKVRERAGLTPVKSLDQESLLELILQERRHELFTEFGHRFFDLKRFGQLDKVLGNTPGWDSTERLLPLPENEILINPNLEPQNPGY